MKLNKRWLISIAVLFIILLIDKQALAQNNPDINTGFIANRGQWENSSQFLLSAGTFEAFFHPDGIQYFFQNPKDVKDFFDHQTNPHLLKSKKIECFAFQLKFDGALTPEIIGENKQKHFLNFFQGNQPSSWRSNVPVYQKLRYVNLYSSIDLVFYNPYSYNLKYDFIIKPGGNIEDISMTYHGATSINLKKGNLEIKGGFASILEQKPFAYQVIRGDTIIVPCRFVVIKNQVRFNVDPYNPEFPLIIDPQLVFSTYSGSSVDNFGHAATYDDQGNLYTAGIARNPTTLANGKYPTTSGAFQVIWGGGVGSWPQAGFPCDIAVSKYNNDGSSLLYATYIGGSLNEYPISIIADKNSDLVMLSAVLSANFPTTLNAIQTIKSDSFDIALTRFNSNGTQLIGSTYFGGNGIDGLNVGDSLRMNYADEFRGELIIAPNSDIYVVSNTTSSNITTSPNAFQNIKQFGQDGLIFCTNNLLTQLKHCSYFGREKQDALYSIDFDFNGNVLIAGGTQSTTFTPTAGFNFAQNRGGISEGFIARLTPSLQSLTGFRYWGGADYDQAYFIKTDPTGNPVVFGQSFDSLSVTSGVYQNTSGSLYVTKFSADLGQIIFSTRLGNGVSRNALSPSAFMVDVCGRIYGSVWGGAVNFQSRYRLLNPATFSSTTNNLPLSADAYQSNTDGSDFWLFVLSPSADSLSYATYFGEINDADHVDGGTSRFDKRGIAYQSICASCNTGLFGSLPTTSESFSPQNKSPRCSNASLKFDFRQGNVLTADFKPSPRNGCNDSSVRFENTSYNATRYYWFINNVLVDSTVNLEKTFTSTGTYKIKLIAFNPGACNAIDSNEKEIKIDVGVTASFSISQDTCGRNIQFNNLSKAKNNAVVPFLWEFGDGDTSTLLNPKHAYTDNGVYLARLIMNIGSHCADTATLLINYDSTGQKIKATISPIPILLCEPTLVKIRSTDTNVGIHQWRMDNKSTNYGAGGFDTILFAGIYKVSLVKSDSISCNKSDTASIVLSVFKETFPEFSYTLDSCLLKVSFNNLSSAASGDTVNYLWLFGDGNFSTSVNPEYRYADTGTYQVTLWVNRGFLCEKILTKEVKVYPSIRFLNAAFIVNKNPLCEPDTLKLTNVSTGANKSYWLINDVLKDSTSNFEAFIQTQGSIKVKLVVINPNGCKTADTTEKEIISAAKALASFSALRDSCTSLIKIKNNSVNFSSSPITYTWLLGNGNITNDVNPNIQYDTNGLYKITLIVNNGTACADTAEQIIFYDSLSHILDVDLQIKDSQYCSPAYISAFKTGIGGKQLSFLLNGILKSTDSVYKDTINLPGRYILQLIVKDSISCKKADTITKPIIVSAKQEAAFSLSRDSCSLRVKFIPASGTRLPLNWYFGNGDSSNQLIPEYEYREAGVYKIMLITEPESFCADTMVLETLIDGDSVETVNVPNVFTPNKDGLNDCFFVKGATATCDEYFIEVYNRWGLPVYRNDDGSRCWNGKTFNGDDLPSGVYFYIMRIKRKNGFQLEDNGTISLIREE
ncbi:MAG: PKD domain-containing protein [Bacteroidia bacterium]|nr:PKD domain-containing protein [Bacteroidia bacterium]